MSTTHTAIRLVETVMACPVGDAVSTAQVHGFLRKRGYSVSRRTVERDLMSLSPLFAIERKGSQVGGYEWTRTRAVEAA